MSIKNLLLERSNSKCELCLSTTELTIYEIPPISEVKPETAILICNKCNEQITDSTKLDVNHWHCLNESMWSEYSAVQVVVWRILKSLDSKGWAQELLEQLYIEDVVLNWAKSGITEKTSENVQTKDSNGAPLQNGDSVTLIKDLNVKGAGFTAKRGTLVKNIYLTDDAGLIEGKVNGMQIVLKTEFLKRSI